MQYREHTVLMMDQMQTKQCGVTLVTEQQIMSPLPDFYRRQHFTTVLPLSFI